MTAKTIKLRHGLTAVVITKKELAAQQRAQKKREQPGQLELEEPES